MTHAVLVDEVAPQQEGPCRKQEEMHFVKWVMPGEFNAADLNSQAVYSLCSVYFLFFSPLF